MTTLYDLKVGDEVVVSSYGSGPSSYRARPVSAVTKTQIITLTQRGHKDRWRKDNGRRVGSGREWSGFKIVVPTEEIRVAIAKQKILSGIHGGVKNLYEAAGHLDYYPISALQAILDHCNEIAAIRAKWEHYDGD